VVAVDASWNETAEKNRLYKEIVFDVYAPEQMTVSKVANDYGWNVMTKTLKKLAQNWSEKNNQRKFYLAKNEDYGQDVYKVSTLSQATSCRFGFVYTRNNSKYPLKETLQMNLEGAKVACPQAGADGKYEIELAPASDHILIFKQT